jgi:O-antigen/teichoic acid export membrane protein
MFPVCSRIQDDKKLLKRTIEKIIQFTNLTSYPLIFILLVLVKPITTIVYTDKWLPAIPALVLFTIQSVFINVGLQLVSLLMAIGKAGIVRNINIFWTVLQWLLTIPLVWAFGFNGLALAGLLVSMTNFIPLIIVRRYVAIDIWPHTLPYLVYSAISGVFLFLIVERVVVSDFWQLLVYAMLGMMIYGLLVLIFKGKEVGEDFLYLKTIITNNSKKIVK